MAKLQAVTVPLRILTLLLSLLVTGTLSVSAHALARSETRVGGPPFVSPVFVAPSASQVAESHEENSTGAYDFSSGVHKYLYCHDDPLNGTDPSGHENLMSVNASIGLRVGLAGAAIGAIKANRTGQSVLQGAAFGFAFGFVGGATFGAAPAAVWTTKAGVAVLATFSTAALNSAIQHANVGYYDLAALDAAFAFAPFALRSPIPRSVGSLGPRPGTLSELDTRVWYNDQSATLRMIVGEMRKGQMGLEAIARYTSDYRNSLKIQGRALMEDQGTARNLPPVRPTDYYIDKYKAEGLTGDLLWEKLIEKSLTPNATVNAKFGIE